MKELHLGVLSAAVLLSAVAALAAGCGGGATAGDGDADSGGNEGTDAADLQPDHAEDAPPDADDDDGNDGSDAPDAADAIPEPTDTVEEEEPPPECEYDDDADHGSYCYGIKVDVAVDVPGGAPRVRYFFDVVRPEGDYDERCAYLDSVIVHGDGGEVRGGEAHYSTRARGFVLEAEAAGGETDTCAGEGRIEVFGIEYTGRSPAGRFHGSCNMGPGWKWPPEVTLACHSGLEASLTADTMEYGPPTVSEVYVDGMFGNHGTGPLTGFSITGATWHNLETMSDAFMLVEPPWYFLEIWSSDPAWEDRVDAGSWHEASFSWSAMDASFPESECPVYDEEWPVEIPSKLVVTGVHSAGEFTIETHPFYCFKYP